MSEASQRYRGQEKAGGELSSHPPVPRTDAPSETNRAIGVVTPPAAPSALSGTRPFVVPKRLTRSHGPVPKISVIVPVYQGAAYVAVAIDSILAQTVKPHEIFVVDDGSTDDLASALAPYGGQITMLHQSHKGVGAACNLGLHSATGDFVIQCDADDVCLPELIEALGDLSSAYPELDILARGSQDQINGVVVPHTPSRRAWLQASKGTFTSESAQRLAMMGEGFLTAHSAFRRERMVRLGGFDEDLNGREDYDSYVRLILDGALAGLVDQCLYTYTRRPGSLSTFEVRGLNAHLRVMNKILSRCDLSRAERSEANRTWTNHRAALDRALAKEAIVAGANEARQLSLRVLMGRGQPLTPRLKALVAASVPRNVAKRLTAQSIEVAP